MGKKKKVVHRVSRNKKIQKRNHLIIFAVSAVTAFLLLFGINQYLKSIRLAKIFANRLDELPTHPYDFDSLSYDEPFWYYDDEDYYILNGIDVSTHQGDIDWEKVKNDGVDFVYIRLGYRGYTEGLLHLDNRFEEYYAGAKESGLKIGLYFFSQSLNTDEAIEEAKFVLHTIKEMDLEYDLPIAFDYEDIDYDTSRIEKVTGTQRTHNAVAFAEYLLDKGQEVIIYTNLAWTQKIYDLNLLLRYNIWIAQFHDVPEFIHPFTIWQYSEKGKIDGIEKPVDLNMMFVKKY